LVRVEDVMADPYGTLGAVCQRLGLAAAESLRQPSWNGTPLEEIRIAAARVHLTGYAGQRRRWYGPCIHDSTGIQTPVMSARIPTWKIHAAATQKSIATSLRPSTTKGASHEPACSGNLSYAVGRVTLTADRGPQCGSAAGGLLFSARWMFAHKQLRFFAIRAQAHERVAPALFGGRPWTKIA
jgi:hypothetical protein